ncbi:MAG: DegV family protein [Candidatus Promineifilaceae bacterium]|nr:DegV family protein [Candidatus Promineifilaceae bacterium]
MQVVIDGAGDLPPALVEELDIAVVPINIMFGDEQFLSGVTMDHAAFYTKVQTVDSDNFPKTSQPTPYQMEQAYRQILTTGERQLLVITVSEKLSGTYESAVAAANALADEAEIEVFDSAAGSAVQGWMAVEAARMAGQGAGFDAILGCLEQMRDSASIYFLIDSLEYAVKGGRVSFIRSTVASLLNIKAIMTVEDGLIVEGGRVRTYRKALSFMVEATRNAVGTAPVQLAVMHANRAEAGQALLDMACAALNVREHFLMDLAISVAVNLGPGALGLVAIPANSNRLGTVARPS